MGKIAFVFPGQGAQAVGMGQGLYDRYTAAKEVYDLCGDDVKRLSFRGPQDDLNLTVSAQPCLFAADLAAAFSLNERGVFAHAAAGFSLGEIPAAAYCGLMTVGEAFRLVQFRANVMQECTLKHKGGMMAVLGLSEAQVIDICDGLKDVYPVNFNAPGQIVAAFREGAQDALKAAVAEAKGKVIPLAVSGGFHSPMMDEAAIQMARYMESVTINELKIPLYANATGQLYDTAEASRKLLSMQINTPVRWRETIEQMIADGCDTFIETGPGKALTGMIKKIDKHVQTYNVFAEESVEAVSKELANV